MFSANFELSEVFITDGLQMLIDYITFYRRLNDERVQMLIVYIASSQMFNTARLEMLTFSL